MEVRRTITRHVAIIFIIGLALLPAISCKKDAPEDPVTSKGWAALIQKPHRGLRSAEMIRNVYEVDPLVCPKRGGGMKIVAFLTEYAVVDRIIRHLELAFVAENPPHSWSR
jgi:hypothetical protein